LAIAVKTDSAAAVESPITATPDYAAPRLTTPVDMSKNWLPITSADTPVAVTTCHLSPICSISFVLHAANPSII
jgi:hypothetical protein